VTQPTDPSVGSENRPPGADPSCWSAGYGNLLADLWHRRPLVTLWERFTRWTRHKAEMLNQAGRVWVAVALGAGIVLLPAEAARSSAATNSEAGRAAGRLSAGGHVGSPRQAPLRLAAFPAHPFTGEEVRFVVQGAPASTTDYRWNLTGRVGQLLDTGGSPRASERFAIPGSHLITVRASEGALTSQTTLSIKVRPLSQTPPPRPENPPRMISVGVQRSSIGGQKPSNSDTPTAAPRIHSGSHASPNRDAVTARKLTTKAEADKSNTPKPAQTAHAASDPGVTIADFQFTPGSTTIHVGDTITWTNNGPSSHTATARNGSFDIGVLKKGASASHTFTQAGTFAYYCKIHPFMHGTIIVQAAASATTPSSTTPETTSSTTPETTSTNPTAPSPTATTNTPTPKAATAPATATTSQTLPMTGESVITALSLGLIFLGLGLTLRRRLR
jgi:plastocyanin